MLKSEYENKGLTGLSNVGNTCYLNSCMQILSHTYELSNFLNDETYKTKLNKKHDSVLLLEWDKLRKLMWSENCTIAPMGFVQAVKKVSKLKGRDIFSGYNQNDLPEFLIFIIDSFHTALMREVEMTIKGRQKNKQDKMAVKCYEMIKNMYKKEYSEMLNIFYGTQISTIYSLDNGEILSMTPEPYSIISLPIPHGKKNVSIFECMDLYCKMEKMEGDNAWYNDKTKKKQDVEMGVCFWSLPNILIIDLKRFDYSGRKLRHFVETGHNNVDFSKYVKGYNSKSYVYDLYAVCNHTGNMYGGHYTAYVKNANNKWYLFNDTHVKEIKEDRVVTPAAYCFFYRKHQK